MTKNIICQHCGTEMNATKKAERNFAMQIFGVAVFFFGFFLLFLFPVGTIIGLFVMLGGAMMGYKKIKIWLCPNCGAYFKRA